MWTENNNPIKISNKFKIIWKKGKEKCYLEPDKAESYFFVYLSGTFDKCCNVRVCLQFGDTAESMQYMVNKNDGHITYQKDFGWQYGENSSNLKIRKMK